MLRKCSRFPEWRPIRRTLEPFFRRNHVPSVLAKSTARILEFQLSVLDISDQHLFRFDFTTGPNAAILCEKAVRVENYVPFARGRMPVIQQIVIDVRNEESAIVVAPGFFLGLSLFSKPKIPSGLTALPQSLAIEDPHHVLRTNPDCAYTGVGRTAHAAARSC